MPSAPGEEVRRDTLVSSLCDSCAMDKVVSYLSECDGEDIKGD